MRETPKNWAGICVSRKVSHEDKVALGYTPVEVDGHFEYLTPLQDRFCRFWVTEPDKPSRAAWLAGYGEKKKTSISRMRDCYTIQYQLRCKKKIMARFLELKKLKGQGINILPED